MSKEEPTVSVKIRTCDRDALKRTFAESSIKEIVKLISSALFRNDTAGILATRALLEKMYQENTNELIGNHARYEYFNELTDNELIDHYQHVKDKDLPSHVVTRYNKLR